MTGLQRLVSDLEEIKLRMEAFFDPEGNPSGSRGSWFRPSSSWTSRTSTPPRCRPARARSATCSRTWPPLRPPSTHKRTHKKGAVINTMGTFNTWVMKGNPVYWCHKFMHRGFIISMTYRTIENGLRHGVICKAVRI